MPGNPPAWYKALAECFRSHRGGSLALLPYHKGLIDFYGRPGFVECIEMEAGSPQHEQVTALAYGKIHSGFVDRIGVVSVAFQLFQERWGNRCARQVHKTLQL